jgi:copper ion binding protein
MEKSNNSINNSILKAKAGTNGLRLHAAVWNGYSPISIQTVSQEDMGSVENLNRKAASGRRDHDIHAEEEDGLHAGFSIHATAHHESVSPMSSMGSTTRTGTSSQMHINDQEAAAQKNVLVKVGTGEHTILDGTMLFHNIAPNVPAAAGHEFSGNNSERVSSLSDMSFADPHTRLMACAETKGYNDKGIPTELLINPGHAFTTFHVDGMTCMKCVGRVERAVRSVSGVVSVRVELGPPGTAIVESSNKTCSREVIACLDQAGYTAHVIHTDDTSSTAHTKIEPAHDTAIFIGGTDAAEITLDDTKGIFPASNQAHAVTRAVENHQQSDNKALDDIMLVMDGATTRTTNNNNDVVLEVDDMTCIKCVGRVERALKAITGVMSVRVELGPPGQATIHGNSLHVHTLIQALDHAGYPARARDDSGQIQVFVLSVDSMTCIKCVGRVERALKPIVGVMSVRVELGKATVTCDTKLCSARLLTSTLSEAGYPARESDNHACTTTGGGAAAAAACADTSSTVEHLESHAGSFTVGGSIHANNSKSSSRGHVVGHVRHNKDAAHQYATVGSMSSESEYKSACRDPTLGHALGIHNTCAATRSTHAGSDTDMCRRGGAAHGSSQAKKKQMTLRISGVGIRGDTIRVDASRVEKALYAVEGVHSVTVHTLSESVTISWDVDVCVQDMLIDVIRAEGYIVQVDEDEQVVLQVTIIIICMHVCVCLRIIISNTCIDAVHVDEDEQVVLQVTIIMIYICVYACM